MARKKWRDMTKAQRRVAIAKDVLKVLELRGVKAAKGIYFSEVDGVDGKFACKLKPGHKCTVCAKGGLMLAFMGRTKLNPGDRDHRVIIASDPSSGKMIRDITEKYIMDKLQPIFGMDTLNEIEAAFELWERDCYHYHECRGLERYDLAAAFNRGLPKFRAVKSPKRRMQGIMGNIIKNKGEFKPEIGPVFYKPRSRKIATKAAKKASKRLAKRK